MHLSACRTLIADGLHSCTLWATSISVCALASLEDASAHANHQLNHCPSPCIDKLSSVAEVFQGMHAGETVGKALHYALQCLPAMPAQQESDTLKVRKYTQGACLNSQSSAAFMPQSNAV